MRAEAGGGGAEDAPRLKAAWKPSMTERPYRCWRPTPSMFMLASSAPTSRPKAPSASASCQSPSPAPAAARVTHTAGWTTLSTARAPVRRTSRSEAIEPTPASTGTAARNTGSSASLRPYRSWSSGMQVTSRAKVTPWSRKPAASAARPARSRGVITALSERT